MATYKVTNANAPIESDYWIDYPIKDPTTNLDSVDAEGHILVERHVTRSVNSASYKSILAKMPAIDANAKGLANLKTYTETNVQALNTALSGANTSITSVTKTAADTATTVSNIQKKIDTIQGIDIDEYKLVTDTAIRTNNANAVHITGNESISGVKTFNDTTRMNNVSVSGVIFKETSDSCLALKSSADSTGALALFYGSGSAIAPGCFDITARTNTGTEAKLLGKPNGLLTWNSKELSTKEYVDTKNATAVHTKGSESISGVKTFTDVAKMSNVSVSGAIYKETSDGCLELKNGRGATGAYAVLYGSDHAIAPGCFDIGARTDSGTITRLIGRPNGSLSWNGKELSTKEYVDTEKAKYLPLTGGLIRGPIVYNGSNMHFHLRGGEDEGSAYLNLYNNLNGGNGQFSLSAKNSTTVYSLVGTPDGQLTWNGSQVMTVGVGTTVTGVNNFSNGLQINGHSVTIG